MVSGSNFSGFGVVGGGGKGLGFGVWGLGFGVWVNPNFVFAGLTRPEIYYLTINNPVSLEPDKL